MRHREGSVVVPVVLGYVLNKMKVHPPSEEGWEQDGAAVRTHKTGEQSLLSFVNSFTRQRHRFNSRSCVRF